MKFTGSLRDYQLDAAQRALLSPDDGFAFFLEMGAGKTRTALKLIAEKNYPQPSLVVCPKTVIPAWVSEIQATTDARVTVLEGTSKERFGRLDQDADIFVINYEGLLVIEPALLLRRFGVLVADESHKIATRTAKQSKILGKIAANSLYVLCMTGTPTRNDAMDLWHQLYVIDGGKRLGENFFAFRSNYFVNVSRANFPVWVPRKDKGHTEADLRSRIVDICDSKKKADILSHLPPKVYHTRTVQMVPKQITDYINMAKDLLVEIQTEEAEGKVATARTALVRYLRLHQIAQGFLYDDDKEVVAEYEPNPKTKALLELLEDHKGLQGKTIVWCIYRHTIEDLRRLLHNKGYNPVTLYGGTPDAGKVVKSFQEDDDVRVLIGQPKAGGLGVTLTAADMAVYYSNPWSWPERIQSEDRAHRIGSEIHDSINIVDIVAQGTIDAAVIRALSKKEEIHEVLTDFRSHLEEIGG